MRLSFAALASALLLTLPSAAQEAEPGWAGLIFGPAPAGSPARIRVIRTTPGSPAAEAGLREEDLIDLAGKTRAGPADLMGALKRTGPGETLELLVRTPSKKEASARKLTLRLEPYDLVTLADRALSLGAEGLVRRQLKAGGWQRKGAADEVGGDASLTALCVRVLLGLPEELRKQHNDAIERGMAFVLAHQAKNGAIVANPAWVHFRTYSSALALQCLCLLNRADAPRARLAAWLLEAQLDDGEHVSEYEFDRFGGWNTWDENRPATMATDISVTSFAIEAIARTGHEGSAARDQALLFLKRTQNLPQQDSSDSMLDGGFTNSPRASKAGQEARGSGSVRFRSYGSPTADGVRSLLYLGVPKDDPRVVAGVAWLAEHFSTRENPNFPEEHLLERRGIYYYYLQSVSDALALYGQASLRTAAGQELPWAELLVKRVVVLQRSDGTWRGDEPFWQEDDPNLAGSWALMALSRCRPFLGGQQ